MVMMKVALAVIIVMEMMVLSADDDHGADD